MIVSTILFFIVFVQLALVLLEVFLPQVSPNDLIDFPKVSVLVAARDEEKNIAACLQALVKQDYPIEQIEVLVGNDDSSDRTGDIIQLLESEYTQIKSVDIIQGKDRLQGKTNVLAQLADNASGEFLAFTDADIIVPRQWLKSMIGYFDEDTGVVTGVTVVRSGGFLGLFQGIDWVFALAMVRVLTVLGFPVTAMGNNMMVRKKAYVETGGYRSIGFSVTEDFALFQSLIKSGWGFKNVIHSIITAISVPTSGFVNLLHQRKRWMNGALKLHWSIVLLLILQALYFPLILGLLIYRPIEALEVIAMKVFLQTLFIGVSLLKTRSFKHVLMLPFYEVYAGIFAMSLSIFYLLPVKMKWKGRRY